MNLFKKTKIICTIGPASDTKEKIKALFLSGMNICRLNFSHGDYVSHLAKIQTIRSIEREMNATIPIILDTKGPEIRLHNFKDEKQLFTKGKIFTIFPHEVLGDENGFSLNYDNFFNAIKVKQLIKVDDGKFVAKVLSKDEATRTVKCKALNTHTLSNHKGVNVVGGHFEMPFLSSKDVADIEFGIANKLNYIAISFVRSKDDVLAIKKVLDDHNYKMMLISKIESSESLHKIDEIIEVSDAIMVARGDLGVEIKAEEVPIIQVELINKCRQKGKPVIIATQMLESMQFSPSPTRAEVNDVALAIFQGADAVMLSAESASGLYPVESCSMQARIATTIEKQLNYQKIIKDGLEQQSSKEEDALAYAACLAALKSKAKLILVFDESGDVTRRLARTRPVAPVVLITTNRSLAYELLLFYGIKVWLINNVKSTEDDGKFIILKQVAKKYQIKRKANIILVRSKHKTALELKEESIRIVAINE